MFMYVLTLGLLYIYIGAFELHCLNIVLVGIDMFQHNKDGSVQAIIVSLPLDIVFSFGHSVY